MQSQVSPQKKTTILVAEDKQVLRLGLKQLCNAIQGCEVIAEAQDGPSTIDRACALHPSVIFIREDLPVLDGVKTTQQIKRRMPDIGVIMLLTDASDFFRAAESGADGYIMRETPEHLIAIVIDTVTNGGAWIGPLVAQYLLHGDGLPVLRGAPVNAIDVPGFTRLTAREKDVLRLLVKGLSNQKIADSLMLKLETVKVHMRSILKKLEVEGRAEVISRVLKAGRRI